MVLFLLFTAFLKKFFQIEEFSNSDQVETDRKTFVNEISQKSVHFEGVRPLVYHGRSKTINAAGAVLEGTRPHTARKKKKKKEKERENGNEYLQLD